MPQSCIFSLSKRRDGEKYSSESWRKKPRSKEKKRGVSLLYDARDTDKKPNKYCSDSLFAKTILRKIFKRAKWEINNSHFRSRHCHSVDAPFLLPRDGCFFVNSPRNISLVSFLGEIKKRNQADLWAAALLWFVIQVIRQSFAAAPKMDIIVYHMVCHIRHRYQSLLLFTSMGLASMVSRRIFICICGCDQGSRDA